MGSEVARGTQENELSQTMARKSSMLDIELQRNVADIRCKLRISDPRHVI